MNNKSLNQNYFQILRKIKEKNYSQRELAKVLGFSLGKINYCLKALQKKGLVKIENFKKSKNKVKYFYILTPAGITTKSRLTVKFMQRMMKEYDDLKKDLD